MKIRIGDLAIARFDPDENDIKSGRKWNKKVCLITGTGVAGENSTRYYDIIYWDQGTRCCDIVSCDLPPHRLMRARPNNGCWNGILASLTIDTVESV